MQLIPAHHLLAEQHGKRNYCQALVQGPGLKIDSLLTIYWQSSMERGIIVKLLVQGVKYKFSAH